MNELQKMFESQIEEFAAERIAKLVKEKLSERGVVLTDEKILEIVKKLNENTAEEISFDIEDNDVLLPEKTAFSKEDLNNLDIEISEADSDELLNTIETLIPKVFPKLVKDTSQTLFNHLRSQSFENVKLLRSDRAKFQSRLEERWRKPFLLLQMFLGLAVEAGAEINKEYRRISARRPDAVLELLIKLHARASQIGLEVSTLIEAGLADGAHARWRTLHEIAVVGQFIAKHGKEVAERYNSHEAVESYKAMLQYQQYVKALRQEEITQREINQIKKDYAAALKKFGAEFKESYGWAAEALGKKKPNFADIENDVGLEKWRPYYKMASHNVHASPKGISFKLGLRDDAPETLLAGASDYGFTDPAHGTAISLLQATSTILLREPNIDKLVLMDVLKKFEELVGEEFLKTQKKYELKFSKF